jgi:hypothetical protein
MTSSEDALLLFKKWNTEKSPIHVLLALEFGSASFAGAVREVDAATVSVRITGLDPQADFMFNLSNAAFRYADKREVTEELKREAEQYEGSLTAVTPSGDRIVFFELKPKNRATRF